jgi:hypothetical protein
MDNMERKSYFDRGGTRLYTEANTIGGQMHRDRLEQIGQVCFRGCLQKLRVVDAGLEPGEREVSLKLSIKVTPHSLLLAQAA